MQDDKPTKKTAKKATKKSQQLKEIEQKQSEFVAKKPKESESGRVYRGQMKVHHDLYQLEVAKFQKNIAIMDTDPPEWRGVEHCHFFHTVDSAGKKLTVSSSIAGHFHLMEIEEQGPDKPPIVKCISGPKKWVRRKNKMTKKWEKVLVPFLDYEELDNHTHDVVYLKSNVIETRTINLEAQVLRTRDAQRLAPIPGVRS